MGNAPETVLVGVTSGGYLCIDSNGQKLNGLPDHVMYRRADLPPTVAAALKLPEIAALVDALESCPATSNPNETAQWHIDRIDAWWATMVRPALAAIKQAKGECK